MIRKVGDLARKEILGVTNNILKESYGYNRLYRAKHRYFERTKKSALLEITYHKNIPKNMEDQWGLV